MLNCCRFDWSNSTSCIQSSRTTLLYNSLGIRSIRFSRFLRNKQASLFILIMPSLFFQNFPFSRDTIKKVFVVFFFCCTHSNGYHDSSISSEKSICFTLVSPTTETNNLNSSVLFREYTHYTHTRALVCIYNVNIYITI